MKKLNVVAIEIVSFGKVDLVFRGHESDKDAQDVVAYAIASFAKAGSKRTTASKSMLKQVKDLYAMSGKEIDFVVAEYKPLQRIKPMKKGQSIFSNDLRQSASAPLDLPELG